MNISTEHRIRIKDIAARAGVSAGTVDRVLHNRGEVAEETRKQILAIVEELGYTPNILAKSLASKKKYTIAALIPDSAKDNPYWAKPKFGVEQAFSEVKDFNTDVIIRTFDTDNSDSFNREFRLLMEMEPDGIIFAPLQYKPSVKIIDECDERRIPYIFIDINVDGRNNLAYFGQNAEQSGFLAAKLMYYGLPEESKVLVIKATGTEGVSYHLQKREKGFLSYFLSVANQKQIQATSVELDITHDEFDNKLESVLRVAGTVKGIFVTNSRAYKVAKYIHVMKITGITLIGYDLIEKNLEYLEKGIISFLIGQKPEEQGYKSVLALFNYLLTGKQVQRINYSPIDIIVKENIDYYKNFKF